MEGRKLAIEKAYLKGKLKSAPAQRKSKSKRSAAQAQNDATATAKQDESDAAKSEEKKDGVLPKGYTKEAKQIAEQQAALAGYRLAAELERVLTVVN